MDCDFSEFSYGYAAVREAETELADVYRQAGAPVLPSLQQEEHLGWDAQLKFVEYALFLQFKRIEYISREHPNSPTWGAVNGPHYRFAIDTDGHQHAALCALETLLAAGADPGEVYYAAPSFHEQQEFDAAYARGEVVQRSHLIAPTDFPLATGRHHFVDGPAGVQILSEPRPPEKLEKWGSLKARVGARATTARDRASRDLTLGDLDEALRDSLGKLNREIPRDSNAHLSRRLQRSAATLGCGLILFVLDDQNPADRETRAS